LALGRGDCFEHGLAALCERHHAVGIFCGLPTESSISAPPPEPILSEELFRELEWYKVWTLEQCRRNMEAALGRLDPVRERIDAYRGWLMVNPRFLQELGVLRARWNDVISELKRIPPYPVSSVSDPCSQRPRRSRDVTDEFIEDFNGFYDRWELRGLATWDLPEPRGGNFSGVPLPDSVARPATTVTIETSPILALPANYPLRAIVEEAQRAQMPEHLTEWLEIVERRHANDLRFDRFRNISLIHFYRNIALASRYSTRFAGHVEAIDRAFGDFLDTGEDSVKKLRLQIDSLRSRMS
jgi:hypothetical protein